MPLAILNTRFCGDLRSKKFFMLDAIPTEPGHYYDPSGHCWCYHTQQPIGPDGNAVTPETCDVNRRCYRSALAAPIPARPMPRLPRRRI